MEYLIIVPEPVLQDIIQISKWYDLQLPGLSHTFEARLEEAVDKLKANPQSFSNTFFGCRRILLKQFPYIIFYKISGSEVKLYAVMHAKRSPAYMKRKLKQWGL